MTAFPPQFGIVLLVLCSVFSFSLPASSMPRPNPQDASAENSFVRVRLTESNVSSQTVSFGMETTGGQPTIPSDDNKPLTFFQPGSMPLDPFSTVGNFIFDTQTIYVFGSNIDGDLTQRPTQMSPEAVQATFNFTDVNVSVQKTVTITDVVTGQPDTAQIRWTATNNDTVAHDITLRMDLDTFIGSNDFPPFIVGPDRLDKEGEYAGTSVPDFWYAQETQNVANPGVVVQGTLRGFGATAPDRIQIVNYPLTVLSPFNFTVDPDRNLSFTRDSAILMYWSESALPPGQTIEWITYYGLTTINSCDNFFNVAVNAPTNVSYNDCTNTSGDTFQVQATITNPDGRTGTNLQLCIDLPTEFVLDPPGQPTCFDIARFGPMDTFSDVWNVRLDGAAAPASTITVELTGDTPVPVCTINNTLSVVLQPTCTPTPSMGTATPTPTPSPTPTATTPPSGQPVIQYAGFGTFNCDPRSTIQLIALVTDDMGNPLVGAGSVEVLFNSTTPQATNLFLPELGGGWYGLDFPATGLVEGLYNGSSATGLPLISLVGTTADNQRTDPWPFIPVRPISSPTANTNRPAPATAPFLNPDRPVILAGGFGTFLDDDPGNSLGLVPIQAWVFDPQDDIDRVEWSLTSPGSGIALGTGDLAPGAEPFLWETRRDFNFPVPADQAQNYLVEIVATDAAGNQSLTWPYLHICPDGTPTPTPAPATPTPVASPTPTPLVIARAECTVLEGIGGGILAGGQTTVGEFIQASACFLTNGDPTGYEYSFEVVGPGPTIPENVLDGTWQPACETPPFAFRFAKGTPYQIVVRIREVGNPSVVLEGSCEVQILP